jgi:hypothetical protein
MSTTIEPTNNIFVLVDGTTTVPNIEFSKYSSQTFRHVVVV